MKLLRVQVKVLFDKKPVFKSKCQDCNFFVYIPSEWNEQQLEAFAFEVAKKFVKGVSYSMFKKGQYKLSLASAQEYSKIRLRSSQLVFRYDGSIQQGKWAMYSELKGIYEN
jgi:hypothetical protein